MRSKKSQAAILAAIALSTPAFAQTSGSWIADTITGSWSVATNWGGAIPDNGGTATFGTFASQVLPVNVVLDSNRSISTLNLDSPFGYTLSSNGSASLTLQGSGSNPGVINVGKSIIGTPLAVGNFGHVINLNFINTSSNGIVINGPGAVFLNTAANYGGGTVVNNATVGSLGGDFFGFSSGSLTLNNATFRIYQNTFSSLRTINLLGTGTIETRNASNGTSTFDQPIIGGNLIKAGPGVLLARQTMTYSGTTTINDGTLSLATRTSTFTGATHGRLLNSTGIDNSGTIVLNNGTGAFANRLPDTTPITLRGGGLTLVGNATAATSETVGTLTIQNGQTYITVDPGSASAANAQLTATALNRGTNRGVLLVSARSLGNAPGAGVGNLNITNAPALVGGGGTAGSTNLSILPWAWGITAITATGVDSSASFVTLGANGIRPLNKTTEYSTSLFGVTTNNLRTTASGVLAAGTTANALLIDSDGLSGAYSLSGQVTLTSGALLANDPQAVVDASVNFGSAEGVVISASTLALNGVVSGSNGLTKAGNGPLAIGGTANTFSGPVTIANGRLNYSGDILANTPGALGSSNDDIILAPGQRIAGTTLPVGISTIEYDSSTPGTFGRRLVVRGTQTGTAIFSTAFAAPVTVTAPIQLDTGFLTFRGQPSTQFTINGKISGPGGITDDTDTLPLGQLAPEATVVQLNGDNDYTGGTEVRTGSYLIGSNTAFGTGTIYFSNALQANGTVNDFPGSIGAVGSPRTIANPVVIANSFNDPLQNYLGAVFAGSQPLTLTGPINLAGSIRAVYVSQSAGTVNFAGPVSDGDLVKIGFGTLILSGNNSALTGQIEANQGILEVTTAASFGTVDQPTFVDDGATLLIRNNLVASELVGISGGGASLGAIRSISGNNTLGEIGVLGAARIAVDAGSTLNVGPVGGGTLTRAGTGTLTVQNLDLNRITLGTNNGVTRIRPDGTTAATSVVDSILITGNGRLDLTNNTLLVDYVTGSTPIATIKGYVNTAFAGGAWTGNGITSSSAAAAALTPNKTTLAVVEATDLFDVGSFPLTFRGKTIDADTVIVKYALLGDSNLNGTVDTVDFNRLISGFGSPTTPWTQGDFNNDSVTDSADFNLLVTNFGQSLPGGAALPSSTPGSFPGALVPEPASLSVLALALTAGATRRRRK